MRPAEDYPQPVHAQCMNCTAIIYQRRPRGLWMHLTTGRAQCSDAGETVARPTAAVIAQLASEGKAGTADPVNHPPHYGVELGGAKIDALDVIKELGLSFSLGNALKYIWRAGRKDCADDLEDLRKAAYYLADEIAWREDHRP